LQPYQHCPTYLNLKCEGRAADLKRPISITGCRAMPKGNQRGKGMDIFYIALAVVFFVLCGLYVRILGGNDID